MSDDEFQYEDEAGPSGYDFDDDEEFQFEDEDVSQSQMADDDDDYNSSFVDVGEPASSKKDVRAMNPEELQMSQKNEITSVASIMNVPLGIAGALLRYYRWNKERLLTEFIEDSDRVFSKAGIRPNSEVMKKGNPEDQILCNICFDSYPGAEVAQLPCGHFFCVYCWGSYLNSKIDDGPACLLTFCPQPKCDQLVDESVFQQFSDEEHWKKYSNFVTRSFVDDNPNIRWCPKPDCGKAVFCGEGRKSVVACSCGTVFCFRCNNEPHAPTSCDHLREWQRKEKDESETANWLAANTKDCPKCKTSIEKNGGCNHMTCSRCRYEFCWVCNGEWAKHTGQTGGYYNCNRYEASESEQNKASARAALERYMHYYTRYANHDRSKKLEQSLRKKAEKKMADLQEKNRDMTWLDAEYLVKAVEQLISCRHCLKWTYVHAFYLSNGPEKNLFEYLQQDLEQTTEKLSEILEDKTDKFTRDEVVNTTRLAEKRLQKLLEDSERGLTASECL